MDRSLNKRALVAALVLFSSALCFSQSPASAPPEPDDVSREVRDRDYKKKDEFYKFHKRSKIISAWQINELKTGALVVRLKTNKLLIDALNSQENKELANEKLAEQFAINKTIVMAYKRNFSFCKLYFMYSHSSDTLLKGARSGIFLDTNLAVDPTITMTENFYLLAERDYVYNSSIGFTKQDSARFEKEAGNPVREMGAVIKNKYGHQLKSPFPYYVKDKTFADYVYTEPAVRVYINGAPVWLPVRSDAERKRVREQYPDASNELKVKIKKQYTYPKVVAVVEQLNASFEEYYKSAPKPDPAKLNEDTRPYLY